MQDQAKRLLLAVGLALVVMVAWNQFFSPPPPDQPASTATGTSPAVPAPAVQAVPRSPVGTGLDGRVPTVPPAERAQPEQRIELRYPHLAVAFSSRDGALVSWRMTDSKYLRDPSKGEMVAPGSRGLLLVSFARSTHVVPAGASWKGEQLSATQVRYTYHSDALEVVKTFTIHPESYLVALEVQVTARGGEAQQRLAVTSYGFQDPKVEEESEQVRAFMSATLVNDEIAYTSHKSLAAAPRQVAGFRWTGFDHPYLLIATAPDPKVSPVEKFTAVTPDPGGIQTDILFPTSTLRPGEPSPPIRLVTYIGPKYYEQLERADEVAGFATGFKDTVDLGWFKIIGRPLLSLLQFLHGMVGNWGIAIILLTVLVKVATLYWTTKSMRSMKAMAALGPKMKELKEKYGNDNAKLQQETMALYKHHGVNPLAGCLPIFLQMPIWIALYRMLSSASELYLQPFIGGWIGDLTSRDPFYILPVVVTVTMFLQTKLQPATGDSTQQKIMLYGMPLMFGVMGLFFPSGLTLYMFTNTVLSALHSLYMNKFDRPSLAMAAKLKEATEASAAAAVGAGKARASAVAAGAAGAVGAGGAAGEAKGSPAKESGAPRGNSNTKRKRKR